MKLSNQAVSLLLIFISGLFLTNCNENDPFRVDYSLAPDPFPIENKERIETESGLIYYIIDEGHGTIEVERRDPIRVFYTGRIWRTDEIFDSSYRNNNPMPTTFNDIGNLVDGFREGVIGMREGEKRVLVIPPELGYGANPSSPLSDDTLRFDVELDEIIF